LKLDLIFNFDEIINVEIEKHQCNIFKGITGMNRDLNMILVQFHKSCRDTREVFYFILFYFKKHQKQKHITFRCSALIVCSINGKTTSYLKIISHFVSSILLVIFYIIIQNK
jgi:hypothetical protein